MTLFLLVGTTGFALYHKSTKIVPHTEAYLKTESLVSSFERDVLDVYEPKILKAGSPMEMAMLVSFYGKASENFQSEWAQSGGKMTTAENRLIDKHMAKVNTRLRKISSVITKMLRTD